MGVSPGHDDPFEELMKPPADETLAQKEAREMRELEAKRISDRIDDQLKEEYACAKEQKVIKVLFLGQSESCKTTILNHFRMRYASDEWEKERNNLRAVVQLNVVRSVSLILRALESEINRDPVAEELRGEDMELTTDDTESVQLTNWHRMLIVRLAPIRKIEAELEMRLKVDDYAQTIHPPTSSRSQDNWDPSRHESQDLIKQDAITTTIAECKEDMKILWADKAVRLVVRRREIRLSDSTGFFLDNLDRIATHNYTVSDDDILHSRERMVSIQEYSIKIPQATVSWELRMYDVRGCRTLRSAWVPYFENVNSIIFLTPVSVFDGYVGDPRINKLQDSIELWTSVCSSKLLAQTQLIHLLSKCELLDQKLKRGVMFKKYIPSYGDRPNNKASVVKYLWNKINEIQKRYSPRPRVVYTSSINAIDTKVVTTILDSISDSVLRENIEASRLV